MTVKQPGANSPSDEPSPGSRELGFVVGLLVGEGSFGGDGRQPQITLRMHVRHHDLFLRLVAWFPGSKLYGPYHHGGRHYHQWMARGAALREHVAPLLIANLDLFDEYSRTRFEAMCATYGIDLPVDGAAAVGPDEPA